LFKFLKLSDFIIEFSDAVAIVDWFDIAILIELAFHDKKELATFAVLQFFHH
jgi:hypothetical protein